MAIANVVVSGLDYVKIDWDSEAFNRQDMAPATVIIPDISVNPLLIYFQKRSSIQKGEVPEMFNGLVSDNEFTFALIYFIFTYKDKSTEKGQQFELSPRRKQVGKEARSIAMYLHA